MLTVHLGISMEIQENHLFTSDDKLKWWGYGEWVEEPDLVKFNYESFDCKVLRIAQQEPNTKEFHVFGGYLCGYVCVPENYFISKNNFEELENLDIHGGVTFSEKTDQGGWWIGFDCAHLFDITPSMEKLYKTDPAFIELKKQADRLKKQFLPNNIIPPEKSYKNIGYCIDECKSLVDQIKNLKKLEDSQVNF
jgi:hypothetical protein